MPDSDHSAEAPTEHRPPEDTPTLALDGDTPEVDVLQLSPGTVLGGRYRIVSLLGRGGMGVVYRADDLKLGQTIAVKFLTMRGAEEHRLYGEVRIGREVSHPNVVRLHDIVEVDGLLFITMELVGGEDLASLLRRIGRPSPERAIAVARDICSGLAAAHEQGVIHRDLKPANVMIDGRGRARITDFGLAVGTKPDSRDAGGGTPAYMAPEQFAGRQGSMLSDVYALGLVLYELFTGRRTFEVDTTRELVKRQNALEFQRPATIVRDIDSSVEQLILRCLEPDPRQRPQSVEEVLHTLPGRDALSAAVAAGETPSPAMVAAADERGDVPIVAAVGLLGTVIISLLLYGALTSRTTLYGRLPLKSPDVLEEKARQLIAGTGQNVEATDHDSVFYVDRDEKAYRESHASGSVGAESILFLYRQSPHPMATSNAEYRVLRGDPPLTGSSMADVTLDSSGRLINLTVVPPQIRLHRNPIHAPDWSPLLAATALPATLRPVPPEWSAPTDSDQKQAWLSGATRIEAASFDGKPVWFAVLRPWTRPDRTRAVATSPIARIALGTSILFLITLPIVAILLALRNLRRGRIDKRGALRFAMTIMTVTFLAALSRAHHVSSFVSEWMSLSHLFVNSTFYAGVSWVTYVAAEPLVRRRWPRMLIGWSRLLHGRLQDPIIGRDLLIGLAAGVFLALAWEATALTPQAAPLQMATTPLSGLRHVAYYLLFGVAEATLRALGLATLLLALFALLRNIRMAFLLALVLTAASFLDDGTGTLATRSLYATLCAAVVLFVLYRFGLLAVAACAYTINLLRTLPITLDPGAWYFGRSLLGLTLLVALALYGFVLALGGKRWRPNLAFDV